VEDLALAEEILEADVAEVKQGGVEGGEEAEKKAAPVDEEFGAGGADAEAYAVKGKHRGKQDGQAAADPPGALCEPQVIDGRRSIWLFAGMNCIETYNFRPSRFGFASVVC